MDEDSLDIRSRVHTLPYIENSNSGSLSNRKPNLTPLKLTISNKLETIVKPPS